MTVNSIRFVLASASPRRHELLSLLGVPFTVVATDAEYAEVLPPPAVQAALPACPLPLGHHPTVLAWRKTRAAWLETGADVVLGADTVVVLGGAILNKPCDADQARAMLGQLSGQTHTVYTGVCVGSRLPPPSAPSPAPVSSANPPGHLYLDLVASDVTFKVLDLRDIAGYVASQEPLDKAGAYALQGEGGRLVQQVAGSFTSVVGLPILATWQLLRQAGLNGLHDPQSACINWLRTQGKEPMLCPPTSL